MDISVNSDKEKFKRRGWAISIVTHILFLILLLIPFLRYPDPPPGQEGITVNLGLPDYEAIEEPAPSAAEPETQPVEEEQQQEERVQPDPPEPRPDPVQEPEVIEQEDPDQIALRKKQEQERQERLQKEREEQERKKAEEEARRKAEEERQRAEAEAAENKRRLSELLNQAGKGEGNEQSGGDPEGEPDTGALESISTGAGKVGGDLAGRGRPTFSPKVTDNSQKQGTVVINVCVDPDGSVVSARFTQRGSTTSDATLKSLAEANAKRWKFPKGSSRDCGTITYTFKVQ